MKLHTLLDDQNAVLISKTPISDPVTWEDFRIAGYRIMEAMQIELEDENAVLKPNVTSGERFADPDTGVTTHPVFLQGMSGFDLSILQGKRS